MKTSTKILLIIASCLILAGCALCIGAAAFTPGGFPTLLEQMKTSSYRIEHAQADRDVPENDYSAENCYEVREPLTKLALDWTTGSVTLKPYDGESVRFEETAREQLDAEHALRYSVKDGVLYIHYCRSGLVVGLPEKHLTVYIPGADFFRSIEIDSVSAAVDVQGLIFDEVEADSASGDIRFDAVQASRVDLSSVSGLLEISGSLTRLRADSASGDMRYTLQDKAESLALSTVSGCITIMGDARSVNVESGSGEITLEGNIHEAELDTVSGEIRASGEFDSFDAESTSGSVSFTAANAPQELDISTISGDVLLALPENADFVLEYETISGDFDSELAVSQKNHRYICGNGGAEYEVETGSGNLDLRKNG